METKLNNILSAFAYEGNVVEIKPMGNGLINDTYRVVTDMGPLQYCGGFCHTLT